MEIGQNLVKSERYRLFLVENLEEFDCVKEVGESAEMEAFAWATKEFKSTPNWRIVYYIIIR